LQDQAVAANADMNIHTWKLTISKKIKTNKLVDHFKNKLTEWLTSQCSSWGRRKKSISSESTTPL